jgi:chromosome segregation ATPase
MTHDDETRHIRIEQELKSLQKVVNQMALNLVALTTAVDNAVTSLQGAAATQAALTQAQSDEAAAQTQIDALEAKLTAAEAPAAPAA